MNNNNQSIDNTNNQVTSGADNTKLYLGGHVYLDETIPEDFSFQCFLHNNRAHFTPIMIQKWTDRGIRFETTTKPPLAQRMVHASYPTYPWSSKESTHTDSINDVAIISKCANIIGIQYEVVHFSRNLHLDPTFEERFVECMSVLSPPCVLLFENIGIKPNVEGTIGTPIELVANAVNLMEKLWPNGKKGRQWGICLDTAHMFATGQQLTTKEDMEKVLSICDKNSMPVKAIHLNGCRSDFNSGIDLHTGVGSPLDNIWRKDKSGVKRLLEWVRDKQLVAILERPKFDRPSHYDGEIGMLKKLIGFIDSR